MSYEFEPAVKRFESDLYDRQTLESRRQASHKETTRLRALFVGGVAAAALAGMNAKNIIDAAERVVFGPNVSCNGTQNVTVTPGDRLIDIEDKNIDVTAGYVNFRDLDPMVQIDRTLPNGDHRSVAPGENLLPGDEVTMPQSCSAS